MSPQRENPVPPNLPAVTTTFVPLLATVVAGFAATAVVGLSTLSNLQSQFSEQAWWTSSDVVIGSFALCIPVMLTAAALAAWGSAFDCRDLGADARQALNITKAGSELKAYLEKMHSNWEAWHKASLVAYLIGLFLLLHGNFLLLWNLASSTIAWLFVIVVILGIATVLRVRSKHTGGP
jgi:hypothetical protein